MEYHLNYLLVALFILYGGVLIKKYRNKFLFFFLIYANALWKLSSLAYIEKGIYILEQKRYSYNLNFTVKYFLFSMLFFLVFEKILKTDVETNHDEFNGKQEKIILIIVGIMLTFMYLNLFMTGIPLISSELNRFNFEQFSKFLIGFKAYAYFPIYSFYLGFLTSRGDRYIKIAKIAFVFIIIYGILISQKFSYYYFAIPMFLFGYAINRTISIKKNILRLSMIIGGVIYLTKIEYSKYKALGESLIDKIMNRVLGLQSHVLWGVANLKELEIKIDLNQQLKNELQYILGDKTIKTETSLYKIMSLISPPEYVQNFFESNVRFAGDYIATLVFMFNTLYVCLFIVLIAFVLGKTINRIYILMKKRKYVLAFFYLQIYISLYQFLAMGVIGDLFIKRFVFSIVIITILEFLIRIIKCLNRVNKN